MPNHMNLDGRRTGNFRHAVQMEDVDLSHFPFAMSGKGVGNPQGFRGGKVFPPITTIRREELPTMPEH